MYGHLPAVEPFLYGIRPATTAIIASAVFRLSKGLFKRVDIAVIKFLVFIGSLCSLNDVALLFGAGISGALYLNRKQLMVWFPVPLLFIDNTSSKLFFLLFKIGAILYGSGYVLFAYMDDALVQHNHWLTRQQLTDAIPVGQITPGPVFRVQLLQVILSMVRGRFVGYHRYFSSFIFYIPVPIPVAQLY